MRTENIERGIVSVVDGNVSFKDSPKPAAQSVSTRKSISVEQGMETLKACSPSVAKALVDFMDAASDRGIYLDAASTTLVVRWNGPDDKTFTLANIDANGSFLTDYVGWGLQDFNRVDLAHDYQNELAVLVGGHVHKTKTPQNWYIQGADGKRPKADLLLNRSTEWLQAIDHYIESISSALKEE